MANLLMLKSPPESHLWVSHGFHSEALCSRFIDYWAHFLETEASSITNINDHFPLRNQELHIYALAVLHDNVKVFHYLHVKPQKHQVF